VVLSWSRSRYKEKISMIVSPPAHPTAVVTRGDAIEAWHFAAVAVVDGGGRLTHRLGDPELITFTRSAIKPLQALPLCTTGAREALAIDDEELALAAASHDGSDLHRAVAARLLVKAGATVEQLGCGAHWPIGMRAAGRHPCAGEDRDPLRHNCSGKHAGFLAVARTLGVAPERYLDPDAPVQAAVGRAVAEACEIDPATMPVATDGCSAPNFALPLAALARGFKNLATRRAPAPSGASSASPLGDALARVRAAMQAHPVLVSGETRFDAQLMRAFAGRIVCKGGAEALQAIGFSDPPLGIAVKVIDGGERALPPIVLGVLRALGLTDGVALGPLADRVRPIVTNHRGTETGAILASVTLEKVAA
jgi:L-asparaginase II